MDLEVDPLETALATAFADIPIPQRRTPSSAPRASAQPEAPAVASETTVDPDDQSRKGEYDSLVTSWRSESANARQKAERERERWRLIREAEEAEERERAAQRKLKEIKEAEWETVERARRAVLLHESESVAGLDTTIPQTGRSVSKGTAAVILDPPPSYGSPSLTDMLNTVSAETRRVPGGESPESLLPLPESGFAPAPQTHGDVPTSATAPPSNAESRTWEQVPSLDSSFPSLSFPDRSPSPSPSPSPEHRERPPPAPSVTLAIFDSSLPTRTRVLAFVSSLAINLLLPFVNGVMLGFGEIFAKNVLSAFGWNLPGMGLGIRAAPKRKEH